MLAPQNKPSYQNLRIDNGKYTVLIISSGILFMEEWSVFALQRESVLLLSFHGHSNWYWHRVDYWFYDFRPNHVARLYLCRFWNHIFTRWWLSSIPHILTVLPFSLRNLIFISAMISHNILRNLHSSLFGPSLTLFCMLCKLFYHDQFLTNCAWLSSAATSFFVFLNFGESISILAELTIDGFSGTSLRMGLENVGCKHLLAHFALFLRVLFGLG